MCHLPEYQVPVNSQVIETIIHPKEELTKIEEELTQIGVRSQTTSQEVLHLCYLGRGLTIIIQSPREPYPSQSKDQKHILPVEEYSLHKVISSTAVQKAQKSPNF